MDDVNVQRLSEKAITISWAQKIDKDINALVLETDRRINAKPFPGWIENVPAYNTLTVYYDPFVAEFDPAPLLHEVAARDLKTSIFTGRKLRVGVDYNGADLEQASEILGLSVGELVKLHCAQTYRVYMIGFMPGFPYMGILPDELVIPRKAVPVPKVRAGSVAIAGQQTGIYPFDSPGGWYVIGHTDISLFSNGKAYFEPGDDVEFYSINS